MIEKTYEEIEKLLEEAITEYKNLLFEIKKTKETNAFDLTDVSEKVRRLELQEQYWRGKVDAFTEALIILKRNRGRSSRGDQID